MTAQTQEEPKKHGWKLRGQSEGRRYRAISTRMYLDRKVRGLDIIGKLVWQYLLCNHHTTAIPGLYSLHETTAAADLGISLQEFRHGFGQVASADMVEADWEAGLVWIRRAWLYEAPQNPNQIRQWRTLLEYELPECPLLPRAMAGIIAGLRSALETPQGFETAVFEHIPEPFREPLAEPFREPFPEPGSRIQDPGLKDSSSPARARNVGDDMATPRPTPTASGGIEVQEVLNSPTPVPQAAVMAPGKATASNPPPTPRPMPQEPAVAPPRPSLRVVSAELDQDEAQWIQMQSQRLDRGRAICPEPWDRVAEDFRESRKRFPVSDQVWGQAWMAYLATETVKVGGRTVELARAKPAWPFDLFKRNIDRYLDPPKEPEMPRYHPEGVVKYAW